MDAPALRSNGVEVGHPCRVLARSGVPCQLGIRRSVVPLYRGGMDFPDSTFSGADSGPSLGALLFLAVVLVLAAASAGVLVAGG